MKFIFSFLFGILILSPTFASYECTGNTQQGQCNCAGWGWVNLDENSGFCEQCSQTQYSPANDSVCHDCIDSGGNWAEGPTRPMHSIFDTNHATAGQASCPWICDSGYFENDAGDACSQCPTAAGNDIKTYTDTAANIGNCNSCSYKSLIKTTKTTPNGSTDSYYCGLCGSQGMNVTQNPDHSCNCPTGTNHTNGENNYNNMLVECACPEGASWRQNKCVCDDPNKSLTLDSTTNKYVCSSCTSPYATNDGNGTCTCNAGYYGNPVGLNTVCHACPTNSTSVVNGVANAAGATSIDQCKCDQNHPIRSTNTTTGAVTCSACPSNATSYNYTTGTDFEYECKCDANYYGNGYISCDKCPAGTTKAVGGSSGSNGRQAPTTQADCKFSNNTKFCVPSTTRTVDNSGYVCFTPNNVTYTY